MPVTEETRHDLHVRLDEVLGQRPALTLMEHLPPVGWADVATKKDLSGLEERIDLRFVATRKDLTELEKRIDLRFVAVGKDLSDLEERMDLCFAAVGKDLVDLEERMDLGFAAVGKDLVELEERMDMRFLRERERIDGQFAVAKEYSEWRFNEVDQRFERLERRMVQGTGLVIAAIGALFAALTWLQPLVG